MKGSLENNLLVENICPQWLVQINLLLQTEWIIKYNSCEKKNITVNQKLESAEQIKY